MFWKKLFTGRPPESNAEVSTDLRAVVLSDLGCVRTNNEDSALFVRPASKPVRGNKGFLAIVADGMGGHSAGEIASQMAIDIVSKTYFERDESFGKSLFLALTKANEDIFEAAAKNPEQKGMGTTCTAVAIVDTRLYLAHVGDSRIYLLKKGQLEQLSKDHTYVQTLVDKGEITSAQAENHPERNVLTRAMGTNRKVEIDVVELSQIFDDDDRLFLCSDGLYDYLSNGEIAELLQLPLLSEAAAQLIAVARQRGGHDNITVLLIERVPAETFQAVRPTEEIN